MSDNFVPAPDYFDEYQAAKAELQETQEKLRKLRQRVKDPDVETTLQQQLKFAKDRLGELWEIREQNRSLQAQLTNAKYEIARLRAIVGDVGTTRANIQRAINNAVRSATLSADGEIEREVTRVLRLYLPGRKGPVSPPLALPSPSASASATEAPAVTPARPQTPRRPRPVCE